MKRGKIEELIDYYRSEIEHITQQTLDIELKSFFKKSEDDYYRILDFSYETIKQKRKSENSKILEFELHKNILRCLYPLMHTSSMIEALTSYRLYKKYPSRSEEIFYYSPFHTKNIDRIIVHGLSHSLWHNIEEHNNTNIELSKNIESQWIEGFAYYGENIYFNFIHDIYRTKQRCNKKIDPEFQKGYQKVKDAVSKNGPEIFLKIPMIWQELESGFKA